MKQMILLLALPVLTAACATPREACLASATRELGTVDRLIAETRGNLERGYAIDREYYTSTRVDLCVGNRSSNIGWSYCTVPQLNSRPRPVAIDRVAEQRKLRELQQTRARLEKDARQKLDSCNVQFPVTS